VKWTSGDGDTGKQLMQYRELGVNLLWVWESDAIESEPFYDRCDELGLMVWQAFPSNASKAIARDVVLGRQHHASLLMWGGHGAALADLVDRLDPTRRLVEDAPATIWLERP
jgi:hypothetical protein